MVTVKKMISELRLGGYLDAADYIEQLAGTHRSREYGYLTAFAVGSDLGESVCRQQLRALWTSYCLHQNLGVDTREYDADMQSLWLVIAERDGESGWSDVEEFYNFMCEQVV